MLTDRDDRKISSVERGIEQTRRSRELLVHPQAGQRDSRTSGSGKLLGQILLEQGKLSEPAIDRVLLHARRKRLRFGEAALRLRLISRADLEHAVAAQFDYPFLDKGAGGYSKKLIAAFEPFSKKGEALRNLRTKLLLRWDLDANRTLAVIGAEGSDASTDIAANLAIVFSQLGHRTLLVDTDMRHASQHRLFNVDNNTGLSGLLIGRVTPEAVIRRLPLFRNLSILTAGIPPPNPVDLLARNEWQEIVADLRRRFGIVILDASSLGQNSGAEFVARACRSVLVTLEKDRTLVTDATRLTEALHSAGAEIVGSVFVTT
jgi:protein-tyrosine kinase